MKRLDTSKEGGIFHSAVYHVEKGRLVFLRTLLSGIGVTLFGTTCLFSATAFPATVQETSKANTASPAPSPRAVLDRYCVTCHNEKLKTAGLMLDGMDVANPPAAAAVWEKVV